MAATADQIAAAVRANLTAAVDNNALFQTQAAARAVEVKKVTDKTAMNAWAAVGGESQRIRMNMQLLAASNPTMYGVQRDAALGSIETGVNNYYAVSLSSYIDSGADLRSAEKYALSATQKFKEIEMSKYHLKFPDSDLGRYIGATANQANAYMDPVSSGGGRKKRSYRKKK